MRRHENPVVALLPLDDRPVNTQDVASLATIAGVEVRLPPTRLLPPRGEPADVAELERWLDEEALTCDALVVSVNALLYGGYVASRRTTDPLSTAIARLGLLRRLRDQRPELPVHASMTLMRPKKTNGSGAEPPYWADHGAHLFALSRELYRAEHRLADDVAKTRAAVPNDHVTDLLARRLRLHTVQLACLELVVDGIVDTFTVLVEDSTVESLSTTEREWLETWIQRLDIGDRVRCLPGADEAGGVLVVRAALEQAGRRPRVAVASIDPAGLDRVAPFEDVPVRDTISGQINSIGAHLVEDMGDADLILAVHPPAPSPHDWSTSAQPPPSATEDHVARFAALVRELVADGESVAVADVAFANGADPSLLRALREAKVLGDVAGYAAWNTAGNAIGSTLAQGCASLLSGTDRSDEERSRHIARRLLDDWGYQVVARQMVSDDGSVDLEIVERELVTCLTRIGPPVDRFEVVPGSVRLPWNRAFEVAFELRDRDERVTHK